MGKPIAIIQGITEHKLTYSSWNSNQTFQNALNLQQITFPWLYGGGGTPGEILKDLENALGVNSFKEPVFFQKEVETLRINVTNTSLH
jgi:hypothetical protein